MTSPNQIKPMLNRLKRRLLWHLVVHNRQEAEQALYSCLIHEKALEDWTADLPLRRPLDFSHFAGLFNDTKLSQGVVLQPIRQAAYLFGSLRSRQPGRVLEIGRYRGGTTLLLAAAMDGHGMLYSIDNGSHERWLFGESGKFDGMLKEKLQSLGLSAELLVGDSSTLRPGIDAVDVLIIDGGHTYDAVKRDIETFCPLVVPGGWVFADDFFSDPRVQRAWQDSTDPSQWRLVRRVVRMAHMERLG